MMAIHVYNIQYSVYYVVCTCISQWRVAPKPGFKVHLRELMRVYNTVLHSMYLTHNGELPEALGPVALLVYVFRVGSHRRTVAMAIHLDKIIVYMDDIHAVLLCLVCLFV